MRLLFILLLFSTTTLQAQTTIEKTVNDLDATIEKLGTSVRSSDSTYIKFYDEFSVHLYSVLFFNTFVLSDKTQNTSINYKPVISPALGIGVSKYGFTLNLSNDFKIIKQSEKTFGETKKFNIKTSFIYKKMWFSGFFSNYKGYYIANATDFNVGFNNEERPQRPDVETTGFGLGYMHVFNSKKFSLNASYTLTQKQLKSAGSFLVGTGVSTYYIKSDSSLIPSLLKKQFTPYLYANNINQYHLEFSVGYSYNFVFFTHLNFNVTAITGITTSLTEIKTEDVLFNTNNDIHLNPTIKLMSALSYVRHRVYAGANVKLNQLFSNTGNKTTINSLFISSQLFVGYRIGSKKKR